MPFSLDVIKNLLDRFFTSVNSHIDRSAEKISKAVEKNGQVDLSPLIDKQTRSLNGAVGKLEKAIEKIKEPKFSGEVQVEMGNLENELVAIKEELQNKEVPSVENIEAALKLIKTSLDDLPKSVNKELTEIRSILGALAGKEINFPQTFQLDKMQLNKIVGSQGPVTNGENLAARNVQIANVSMSSADTEYSYTFPANTASFFIKVRSQNTLLYYAWETGKLPNSGDGSAYKTVPQNGYHSPNNLDIGGKTIYLETGAATQVAEIDVYTL